MPRPKVSEFEPTTLVDDGRDEHSTGFFHGVPHENSTSKARLAERSLLQGAKGGLLDDRVAVDGESVEFP